MSNTIIPYKYGDVIVRCYKDKNINAISIYIGETQDIIDSFLYIDNSFSDCGGLSQFNCYSMNIDSDEWYYRYATFNEATNILRKLIDDLNIFGNIYTNSSEFKNMNEVIDAVNNYKKFIRKEKLLKLKYYEKYGYK